MSIFEDSAVTLALQNFRSNCLKWFVGDVVWLEISDKVHYC